MSEHDSTDLYVSKKIPVLSFTGLLIIAHFCPTSLCSPLLRYRYSVKLVENYFYQLKKRIKMHLLIKIKINLEQSEIIRGFYETGEHSIFY